jgi:hypothetical protein
VLPALVTVLVLQARAPAALSPLGVGAVVAGGVVAGLALVVVLQRRAIAAWARARATRKRAERRRLDAGVLRAIVDAEPGQVRVRGRVRTLRPVPTPAGDLVAAFRGRRIEGAGARREVVEVQACGRFLVDDGSGLALVDDDAFAIEPLDVPARGGLIALRDGDLVEVVGPARREPPPEDVARRGDGETVLMLDGTREAPVLLVALPIAASLAPPRSRAVGAVTRPGPHTLEHDALRQVEAGGRAEAEARGPITGPGR